MNFYTYKKQQIISTSTFDIAFQDITKIDIFDKPIEKAGGKIRIFISREPEIEQCLQNLLILDTTSK